MTPELGHIDAVVFDLDGTLIDSASDIAHAINATLASVGLQPVDLATVQGWIGNGPNALIASARSRRRTPHRSITARCIPASSMRCAACTASCPWRW